MMELVFLLGILCIFTWLIGPIAAVIAITVYAGYRIYKKQLTKKGKH